MSQLLPNVTAGRDRIFMTFLPNLLQRSLTVGRSSGRSGILRTMLRPNEKPDLSSERGRAGAGRSDGFTLLEVLVALAIALPALTLLYRQGTASIGVTQAAASYQEAISRAQSRLEALTDGGLVPGERNGDDGGGYRWRTRVVTIASAAQQRPLLQRSEPRGQRGAGGTTLFGVAVEISWPGPQGTRAVTLDTRRLGAAAAGP